MPLKLNRLTPQTLRDAAYQEIRRAVLLGNFEPGEAITIRELCEALGIGLSPVREGVQLLASQGALEVLPNRSVRVPVRTEEDLTKLFEARQLVEGFATEQAAPHMQPSDVTKLTRLLDDVHDAQARSEPEAGLKANFEFHFLIYRHAQSPYLLDSIERLWLAVGPLLAAPYRASPAAQQHYAGAKNDHFHLIDAIKAGDGKLAGELVRRVLRHSLTWYLAHCVGENATLKSDARTVTIRGSSRAGRAAAGTRPTQKRLAARR